jgi:hypothetical protein
VPPRFVSRGQRGRGGQRSRGSRPSAMAGHTLSREGRLGHRVSAGTTRRARRRGLCGMRGDNKKMTPTTAGRKARSATFHVWRRPPKERTRCRSHGRVPGLLRSDSTGEAPQHDSGFVEARRRPPARRRAPPCEPSQECAAQLCPARRPSNKNFKHTRGS